MFSSPNINTERTKRNGGGRRKKSDEHYYRIRKRRVKAMISLPQFNSSKPRDPESLHGKTTEKFFWASFNPKVTLQLLPPWLPRVERASIRQDKLEKTDAVAVLINNERIRVQIKSSWESKRRFDKEHARESIVCVVITYDRTYEATQQYVIQEIQREALLQYPELFA